MRDSLPGTCPFLGIHAVNVYVRDHDASLRFYVDKLGFRLVADVRLQSGDRWVAVAPPDGTTVLALRAPPPDSKAHRLIGQPTGIVFITENVAAKFDEWHRRGVRFLFTPRLRRVRYQPLTAGQPAAQSAGDSDHRRPRVGGGAVTGEGQEPGPAEPLPVWGGVFTRFKDVDGNSFALVGFDAVNREIQAQRRQAAEKLAAEHRAAQELEIARQVQARLFPQSLPPIPTLDYAGACVQARQVGGDYHDFLDLGRGHFGLVIADISGKGIAAALLMANLQANLRSQCASSPDEPARLLRSVNMQFYENTADGAYATLFFAEYDDRAQRLHYANCGHLSGLLFRRDGTLERLESTTTVLGLFKEWDCPVEERRLFPGDTLALYTDGITESFSGTGEEFGEHRLIEALARRPDLRPRDLVGSILDQLQRFSSQEQHDDITLIVARCRPA